MPDKTQEMVEQIKDYIQKAARSVMKRDNRIPDENGVLRILFIANNAKDVTRLRKCLSHSREYIVEIEVACNLAQALYKLHNERFSLVLLDGTISSPMTAEEILEHLCEHKIRIPVVAIVANDDEQTVIELMKLRVSGYITKDKLGPELLEKTISSTLAGSKPLIE